MYGLDEDDLIQEKLDSEVKWERPSWPQVARGQVISFFKWRMDKGLPPLEDQEVLFGVLDRLSEEELATLKADEEAGPILRWVGSQVAGQA